MRRGYLVRLIKVFDWIEKLVPMKDDVFDFFLESQPGLLRHVPRQVGLAAPPDGGPGADDPARRAAPPDLAVRQDGPRGLRPGRLLRGIDIMRAVRGFDPCLPCGVHIHHGKGRTLERRHSPIVGASGEAG